MPGGTAMALVTTAVEVERDAVCDALGEVATVELGPYRAGRCETGWGVVDVVSLGVGPVAAAAGTAHCLGVRPYDLVVCAGIAGRYPLVSHAPASSDTDSETDTHGAPDHAGLVVSDRVVLDGFGAETAAGVLEAAAVGLGVSSFDLDDALVRLAARRSGATIGTIVTVLAATGTPTRAWERAERWAGTAEAMEGAGAHAAALASGVAFLELRAISNTVGDRDRTRWDIEGAVQLLGGALGRIFAESWS